ncbi:MAG: restriction endonuclease subunit S [Methanoregula sp.]|jgi:type I restriction enzyme S subunit
MIETPYGSFPEEYHLDELEDLCVKKIGIQTGPFGSQLHNSDYVSVGTPILTVEHLGENRIIHENLPRVTEEDRQRLSRYSIKKGDIIFSRVGSVDRRALVRDAEDGWLFSGRCLRVRPDPEKLDSIFLSYLMGLPTFQEYVRKIAVGATMPSINTEILSGIPICYPPLPTQHAIARILGSLDDKIELNRQMNETLEAMAKAIFQSWFVDFDPVRAKAEGRQPAGMDAATAALFPGEFEEVDGREVPRGWGVEMLSESFIITMGQSPPGITYNENGEGVPFFQGRTDFGFRYPTVRVYCTVPTRFAEAGDSLVSVRAPVGDINLAQAKCCIGRGVAAVRHKTGSRSFTYYQMLSFKDIFALFESEGTVFGSIAKTDFNSIECITPPKEIVKKFEQIVFPIDQMIENNEQQSRTLAQIRDALLPRLMSGEMQMNNLDCISDNK